MEPYVSVQFSVHPHVYFIGSIERVACDLLVIWKLGNLTQ